MFKVNTYLVADDGTHHFVSTTECPDRESADRAVRHAYDCGMKPCLTATYRIPPEPFTLAEILCFCFLAIVLGAFFGALATWTGAGHHVGSVLAAMVRR